MPPTVNFALFQDIESKICNLYSKYPAAKVIWGGDFKTVLDEKIVGSRLPESTNMEDELNHMV